MNLFFNCLNTWTFAITSFFRFASVSSAASACFCDFNLTCSCGVFSFPVFAPASVVFLDSYFVFFFASAFASVSGFTTSSASDFTITYVPIIPSASISAPSFTFAIASASAFTFAIASTSTFTFTFASAFTSASTFTSAFTFASAFTFTFAPAVTTSACTVTIASLSQTHFHKLKLL